MENMLWYKNPAKTWTEALPLGNGKLGAMVFGGIASERIQLNEDSVWSGGFRDRNNPDAKDNLDKVRSLLKEGKIAQAEDLARYSLSGTPEYQRTYQTLGDVSIKFQGMDVAENNPDGYIRSLDLANAICAVGYTHNGYKYEREIFVSKPANAIVIKLTTDNPDGMSFDARLIRNRLCERSGSMGSGDGKVFVDGVNGGANGISFCFMMSGKVPASSDGDYADDDPSGEKHVCVRNHRLSENEPEMRTVCEYLVFRGVKEALLYVTAYTSYRCADPATVCKDTLVSMQLISYDRLKSEHISDYQQYEKRMTLEISDRENTPDLPTDERLTRFQEDKKDIGLIELYFRYGRYLLISCSRPGSLPANLQGIWCNDYLPPWDSKYTININTQMNYWPAEVCNLSDMHMPLFDHIARMYENGIHTARTMYGARGFVAHHNTDIWGDTAPQDTSISSTYWVMGAAWLCLHIWDHYIYTLDTKFLEQYFYLLRDAAVFFIDVLLDNGNGEMVMSPTSSPENVYVLPDGAKGRLCQGCAMDSQILTELFKDCIAACHVLDTEAYLAVELEKLIKKLPKT